MGGFWTRKGDIEIDIVALNEEEGKILFGECKLKGSKFTRADVQRLKEKAVSAEWRAGRRKEYYALFSMDALSETQKKSLEDILIDVISIAIGVWDVIYHKSLGEKTAYIQQRGYGKWFHVNLITDRSIKSYQRGYLIGAVF